MAQSANQKKGAHKCAPCNCRPTEMFQIPMKATLLQVQKFQMSAFRTVPWDCTETRSEFQHGEGEMSMENVHGRMIGAHLRFVQGALREGGAVRICWKRIGGRI